MGSSGLADALASDHDRLTGLQERAFLAAESGDSVDALRLFRAFAAGFRRHMGFEEDLLFPEIEARSGVPKGPGTASVLRAEHRELEELIGQIEAQIADPDAGGVVLEARRAFQRVLREHNVREERFLYGGVDRLLSEAEREALFRRLEAYPESLRP